MSLAFPHFNTFHSKGEKEIDNKKAPSSFTDVCRTTRISQSWRGGTEVVLHEWHAQYKNGIVMLRSVEFLYSLHSSLRLSTMHKVIALKQMFPA